ncbi:MAG TPA: septal ring lytic transglycosylase RlpA family protein [Candidatus Paceibacterota bacterium]
MTKRVAIAIWILGLFVTIPLFPSSLFAADYYIVRKGDMLYRVPHSAHRTFFDNGVTRTKHIITSMSLKSQIVKASWYGPRFHGRPMANGEAFNMFKIFIAHKELPLGTCVRVKNLENGRAIQAPISDRGPYIPGRKFDLSCYAMGILGGIEQGVIPVKYNVVPQQWCKPSAEVNNEAVLTSAHERCQEENHIQKN